jgi:hypothetical protein
VGELTSTWGHLSLLLSKVTWARAPTGPQGPGRKSHRLRVARLTPKTSGHGRLRSCTRRILPRTRVTGSVMVPRKPGVHWEEILPLDLEMGRVTKRVSPLLQVERGPLGGIMLLLTQLEVRAYHVHRTVHHLPLQQRRWRELSCFWIFLQRQISSRIGGLLSKALLVSLTATPTSGRAPHGHGKRIRRTPGATKLVVAPPPYVLHLNGRDHRLVGSTLTMILPRHQIHGFVVISARFFVNEWEKTPEPESSGEEKRVVSPTSAQGPLLVCMRQGIQRTYRMR